MATRSHHEEELLGKTVDARPTRRLLQYVWRYKWHAFTALLLSIFSAPLVLVGALLTKVAVDLYFAPQPNDSLHGLTSFVKSCAERLGLGDSAYEGIVFISLIFLATNFLTLFMRYGQDWVLQVMGQRIMFDLRKEIFAHLHRLPVQFFDRNPVGRLMTRLTTDVSALNEVFTTGVIAVLGNVAVLLFIMVWMFWANWQLGLISLAVLPLLVGVTIWFRIGTRTAVREVHACVARINSFLQEHLTGMSVVHLFNREEQEMSRFKQINDAQYKANVDVIFYTALFTPAIEVVGAVGVALVIWYGGGLVLSKLITIGTVIAFLQLAKSFYDPITSISEKYSSLQSAIASSERVFKLLDEPVEIQKPDQPLQLGRAFGRIEFRDVWFAYQDEDWILKDVSFLIEPGERIAIVGHTGAGKTTIANLLLRLYDIQRGQILLDGKDIAQLDTQELRSNFAIVLQDVFLFAGDIKSNISLGNASITDEMIYGAAREVHADAFIEKLPNGFDTVVRERGLGLSVGQKQLISFARALASDPSVLILDEATSSIDTDTEELIAVAVARLMKGRTSLVIAHRLSTIQTVDKIIVLHKGEVREMGTHKELLAQQGLYWRLYRLQFAENAEELVAYSLVEA